MSISTKSRLIVLMLNIAFAVSSHAATSPDHDALDTPVKIYSNICMGEESGDLIGHQLVLHDWGRVLLFQQTSGWYGPTQVVDFKLDGDKITFSVHVEYDGRPRTVNFSGVITKNAIIGAFDDDSPYLSGPLTFETRPNKFPNVPGCTDENFPFPNLAKQTEKMLERLNP